MNILIDADGCPVVDLTLQIAKRFGISVIILCDTSHQIEREGAQTLVFDKGSDSVDFALVNRVKPGDVVVTQDYGLASMCLARCASLMVMNGVSMKQVQEWLGHSIFSTTTDIYAHLDYKSKEGSAGVIANVLGESKSSI
jgi:uncharacterized protein YaiI (UPF0178 family)